MYYYRCSNAVLGYLNLLTLLASVPIIGAGLWAARSSATCESSLQTPLLVIGFIVLLVSLIGFIGACFHVAWALWLYLCVLLMLVIALLGVIAFGFAVTGGGGGVPVAGRVYREYRLEDYSGWLRHRITEDKFWRTVGACIVGSKACSDISQWTPLDYLQKDLTPIQSGCCKPPTSCTYTAGTAIAAQDDDCYKWSNAANVLCYDCNSCKAGALEQIRRDWHKLSILNVVLLIFLVFVSAVGCCAFRNVNRDESEYNRRPKNQGYWDYYWPRWGQDRRRNRFF